MTTALERLEEQLDTKDAENSALQDRVGQLERELEGTIDGWRIAEIVPDSGLPVPRLELVYIQRRDWYSYKVLYRMVHRHLLGHLVGVPLGLTRVDGGGAPPHPGPQDLPMRDGAHARHDSEHLQMPLFKIMPGNEPVQISPIRL